MKLAREFPPNPHAVLFHADARLTDEVVRTWFPDRRVSGPTPSWATALLAVAGLRVLSANAYKIRVQKCREVGWCDLLPRLEAALRDELTVGAEIADLHDTECRRRAFAWHGPALQRRVFEGRRGAQPDPIAGPLFELRGVAEVILDGHCIEVRKCPLFGWSELAGPIEARIEQAYTRG